jgi:hypothetical protein
MRGSHKRSTDFCKHACPLNVRMRQPGDDLNKGSKHVAKLQETYICVGQNI